MLLVAGGPVTLAIGGALVVGSLIHEYREGIGDFVLTTGDVAGATINAVGDAAVGFIEGTGSVPVERRQRRLVGRTGT